MGHVATPEPSSSRWRALYLGARGGARALWHRERTQSHGADLLSLVHSGTRYAGYRHFITHVSLMKMGDTHAFMIKGDVRAFVMGERM
jgi:hypothetical protein